MTEVQYCRIKENNFGDTRLFLGILYRSTLFKKLELGPFKVQEGAVRKAREIMDLGPEFLPVLVVWGDGDFKLFQASPQAELESFQGCPLLASKSELLQVRAYRGWLTQEMRKSDSLVRDRRLGLKRYRKCFSAKLGLNWVVSTCNVSRQQACCFFQHLIDEQLIYSLDFDPVFRDDDSLYRFYDDEIF